MFSGLACLDAMDACPAKVVVVAEGMVASMLSNACFMIHQRSRGGGSSGGCALQSDGATCSPGTGLPGKVDFQLLNPMAEFSAVLRT